MSTAAAPGLDKFYDYVLCDKEISEMFVTCHNCKEVKQILQAIIEMHLRYKQKHNKNVLLALHLNQIELAAVLNIRLDIENLTSAYSKMQFHVLDRDGYDFSLEYLHIYKGDFSGFIAYNVYSLIIRKAILSIMQNFSMKYDNIGEIIHAIITTILVERYRFKNNVANELKKTLFVNIMNILLIDDEPNANIYFELDLLGQIICYFQIDGLFHSNNSIDSKDLISIYYYRKVTIDNNFLNNCLNCYDKSNCFIYMVYKDKVSIPNEQSGDEIDDFSDNTSMADLSSNSSVINTKITKALPVMNSQVYSWGDNEMALGYSNNNLFKPRLVPLPLNIYLQQVKSIASSNKHTLLLTYGGEVYSCGDNSDGALGHGDNINRSNFFPIESISNVKVSQISVGSCTIGCHSVALDNEGKIYGWGIAQALGLSKIKPYKEPTIISIYAKSPLNNTKEQVLCSSISCGNGFTVALTVTGHIYSWGQWTNGRLGHGPIPVKNFNRRNKSLAKFQLSPLKVKSIENAKSISCGNNHTLCVLKDGSLIGWGQNCYGQIGCGISSGGLLSDQYKPVYIKPFQPYIRVLQSPWNYQWENGVKIITANSAETHSIALDFEGNVWSWGGKGESMLGHGLAYLPSIWINKIDNLILQANTSNDGSIMMPYELKSWFNTWTKPRKVSVQFNEKVVQIASGKAFTAVLTYSNRLWLCGSGLTVPPIINKSSPDYDEKLNEPDDEYIDVNDCEITEMNIFTSPSSIWLSEISNRCCTQIYNSGGDGLFILLEKESITHTFTSPLLNRLLHNSQKESIDDVSFDSNIFNESSSFISSYLIDRGYADCIVISSGKIFPGHRAILSNRCPGIRDIITNEMIDNDSYNGPLQILLPELNSDTAVVLLYFIYNDTIPISCAKDLSLLHSLSNASRNLQLYTLQILCDSIINDIMKFEYQMDNLFFDHSLLTLTRDIGKLVGDPQFSDIRFIAEGKAIYSHKFILTNRCEYFKAMFRSGMAESYENFSDSNFDISSSIVDVVVPDSYIGFLRLLIYIYTDNLLDGSSDVILDDLMLADRYGIDEMRITCENMISINSKNWIKVLEVADLINSVIIRGKVVRYLSLHMNNLTNSSPNQTNELTPELSIIQTKFPDVLDDIIVIRQQSQVASPPKYVFDAVKNIKLQKEAKKLKRFPLIFLVIILVGLISYQQLSNAMSFGYTIPIVNVLGIVIILYFTAYRVLDET